MTERMTAYATEKGQSVDMTYELASSIFLNGIKGNKKSKPYYYTK